MPKRHITTSLRLLMVAGLLLSILTIGLGKSFVHASVNYYLPYTTGYTAQMTQGPGGTTSHNIPSTAEAYDFVIGGGEVWASAPGQVVAVQTTVTGQTGSFSQAGNASSGNYVSVKHADNTCTHYLHMAHGSITVNVGTQVSQGQKLGVEGNTGYTLPVGSGHHLHFERDNCGANNSLAIDFVENNWTSQNSQGGSSTSGEGGGNTASWAASRLDVFVQGTNTSGANMYHRPYTSIGWGSWELTPGTDGVRVSSQPAAISWGPDRIDVFARSTTGSLIHKWFTGTSWTNWEDLGGCLVGSPAVSSWAEGRLDVFVQGCNETGPNLLHRPFANSSWGNWEVTPGTDNVRIASSPSAVSWGLNRIDVFARSINDTLIHKWFTGTSWTNWEDLGGCMVESPGTSSWEIGRLDVFVQGCNTTGPNMFHRPYVITTGWGSWELTPGTDSVRITGSPSAVSWAPGRIDVFARGVTGALTHKWFTGTSWTNWESLGGGIAP